MFDNLITFEVLPVAAIVLSLFLGYFPGVKKLWSAVESADKQKWMLLLYAVVVLGAWGLSQLDLVAIYPKFAAGAWQESVRMVFVDYIAAVVANFATYGSTKHMGNRR